MKKLSNLEFVILSLVAEKPIHGYLVEHLIVERGMREWTDIGFSSIYHVLGKLQKAGFLTSLSESAGDRPARTVFSLTPQGTNLLHDEVFHRLSTPHAYSADFDLALTSLPVLNKEEILLALETFQEELSRKIQEIEGKQSFMTDGMESHVIALFDHSLKAMHSELDWISNYLSKWRQL
jgi:DNA-binding PadR family transcriptional regulator